ncbi:MAG: hypothetical protein WCF68_05825, partial [Terriglobales bacterium]
MRKWMNERLKRRKKPADGPAKEATKAQEPLQPRFYDDEPGARSKVAAEVPAEVPVEVAAETPVVAARRPSKPEPAPDSDPVSTPASASAKPTPGEPK